MTTALVTGASGFVGSALVRALQAAGDDVVCLVRPTSDRRGLRDVRFAVGDMADPSALRSALEGVDVVYHAAAVLKAPWRADFQGGNVEGAACVAQACATLGDSVPVLVLVSSLAAAGPAPAARYGEALRARLESDPPAPVSRYGRAKLACEAAVLQVADRVPVSIVRPPTVLGDGDRSALPLFRLAARGIRLRPGPPDLPLSVVDVADLARLLRLVAVGGERLGGRLPDPDVGAGGRGVYFAADPQATSWAGLSDAVAHAVGQPGGVRVGLPAPLVWAAAAAGEAVGRLRDRPSLLNLDKAREATAGAWWCSGGKAAETLGFAATPLAVHLAATAAGYRGRGWL